jgi:hypothetical protein
MRRSVAPISPAIAPALAQEWRFYACILEMGSVA